MDEIVEFVQFSIDIPRSSDDHFVNLIGDIDLAKGKAGCARVETCRRVGEVLTPDLLTGRWKSAFAATGNSFAGHCYAAAEALYHMVGGREKGWLPCVMSHACWPDGLDPGETHWFIRNRETGQVLDPTAGQFETGVPYRLGKGCGFLTKLPSRRARTIIDRVLADGRREGMVREAA